MWYTELYETKKRHRRATGLSKYRDKCRNERGTTQKDMVFSSLLFVFFFLVVCYGVYAFAKTNRQRNVILLIFSLIFYAFGGPPLLLLLCGVTFVCYIGALLLAGQRDKGVKKSLLAVTVGACLAVLVIFKYTGFFLSNFKAVFGIPEVIPQIALPLGISFYTFQLLSYVVDVYRGEVEPQRNYFLLLLYAALFHQCIAGPIVRYADINHEINHRTFSWQDASVGVTRFAVGLAKKAILANGCATLADKLLPTNAEALAGVSAGSVALGAFCYALQIYLDFSAYSDMAIGMGLMIGFHYKENFNYPYVATSVTDFWRRWHISLSSFFRDYVYIPLGGNRCNVPRQIFNLAVVWFLTGLWHGASWNFVFWGLYYLLFLLLEKFVFRIGRQTPTGGKAAVRRLLVGIVVWFGWILFRYEDLSLLGTAIGTLFTGGGNGFWDLSVTTALVNNCFFLAVCILACTPVVPYLAKKLRSLGETGINTDRICSTVCPALLLVLSVFSLVGNNYNPFLYFNF